MHCNYNSTIMILWYAWFRLSFTPAKLVCRQPDKRVNLWGISFITILLNGIFVSRRAAGMDEVSSECNLMENVPIILSSVSCLLSSSRVMLDLISHNSGDMTPNKFSIYLRNYQSTFYITLGLTRLFSIEAFIKSCVNISD